MTKSFSSLLLLSVVGFTALFGTACSQKDKSARHLAKADQFFNAGQYEQAEIEYKNVLQLEPQNPTALGRLGIIFFDQTRVLPARSLLLKASELAPQEISFRLKLAYTDLAIRDLAGASTKAKAILTEEPTNPDAPLLLTEAITNPQELDETRQFLLELSSAEGAPVLIALGVLDLRQNKIDDAEKLFLRAVELDPKSANAHAAMSAIHLLRKNLPLAEQELKLAAELSPDRSSKRIQYAQFKIQNGDIPAGRKMLKAMTVKIPDFLPAWMLLAQLDATDKKFDEALELIGKVLSKDNAFPEALILRSRVLMAKGEFDQTILELQRALTLYPTSPQFHYQLGLAYVAKGESRKAMDSLNKALTQAPGYTDASVLLASLDMQTGDPISAINALKIIVRQHPELIQPRLLLADAYRASNNLNDALAVYEGIEKSFPGNPRTPLFKGNILLRQNKREEARNAFTEALARQPDMEPALEQLLNLDLAEKKFAEASLMVDQQLAQKPDSATLYFLRARISATQNDLAKAEADLQKGIELQPDAPTGYFMLSALHLANRQTAKALESLQQIVAKNPNDVRALTMIGMLQEQQQNYDKARAAYETILTTEPKSGIALNNLAMLYATHYHMLEKAYDAATKARDLFPREPNFADTLGWILVLRHQYPWALTLLQESAERLPNSAEVQYHLGVVQYLMGNDAAAKATFDKALQINSDFDGATDARQHLAILAIDPDRAGLEGRKLLNTALAKQPDDPTALLRLAAIDERDGHTEKAFAGYKKALKANPANLPAMLNLIRLHEIRNETKQALAIAKAARKVAPNNNEATFALGRLAFRTGDYPWAFSLLQEADRKQPDNPAVLRELARAAYSIGRVTETEETLRRALQRDGFSPAAKEARGFLDMISLGNNPKQALAADETVMQKLQSNPRNVPALMAAAVSREEQKQVGKAVVFYQQVLAIYPDFNPAKRRLTVLTAANSSLGKVAMDLALQARTAYPDDPELAKALGIILYRQKDYARALSMLKQGAVSRDQDAELQYYLGMTQFRLNDNAAAKTALSRALELGLLGETAAMARKTLTELK